MTKVTMGTGASHSAEFHDHDAARFEPVAFFSRFLTPAIVALPLLFLSRLPLLLNLPTAADGDECLVGIMALHASQGREFPVFFYGQNYSLTTVEALAAAAAFHLWDASPLVLKGVALSFWSLSGMLLIQTVRIWIGTTAAWLTLLLLATCPAWGEMSVKAWSGYLTAYLFCNLTLWLLARNAGAPQRLGTWATIGLTSAVVLLAQPIWALALFPFLVVATSRRRNLEEVACAAAAGGVVIVFAFANRIPTPYWSPNLFKDNDLVYAWNDLSHRLFVLFAGAHRYSIVLPSGSWATWGGASWLIALVAAYPAALYQNQRNSQHSVVVQCGMAMLMVCGFVSMISFVGFGYRYLLPIPAMLIVPAAIVFSQAITAGGMRRGLAVAATAWLMVSGSLALDDVRTRPTASDDVRPFLASPAEVDGIVRFLQAHDTHHVYSLNELLQFNLTFCSREQVIARWYVANDRCPEYVRQVDLALKSGKPVAIVGVNGLMEIEQLRKNLGKPPSHSISVGRLFVSLDADAELIEAIGFSLTTAE